MIFRLEEDIYFKKKNGVEIRKPTKLRLKGETNFKLAINVVLKDNDCDTNR